VQRTLRLKAKICQGPVENNQRRFSKELGRVRLLSQFFEATAGLSSNQENGRKGVGPLGFY
jgi:hypothetical protein